MNLREFYKDKKVFVTGHTGFKGSWLVTILNVLGAKVCGYALPYKKGEMFDLINGEKLCESHYGDIADLKNLKTVFDSFDPDIVIHLAAQPLVLKGYREPRETYLTNVFGTINLLECVRLSKSGSVKSVINVTTDKVYKNKEVSRGYKEDEELDGFDPYSNSKSCSELVTHCYKNSYFDGKIAVSTVRAGNVIGGGDFSEDRIIPDCVRFCHQKKTIEVRNPYSVRPYQFVMEPLIVYLDIAKRQYEDKSLSGYYNVGPDDTDCITTGELVSQFCAFWGEDAKWINASKENAPHESNFLKLDNSKIKEFFGWKPKTNVKEAVSMTVDFAKNFYGGGNVYEFTLKQIDDFLKIVGE